MKSIIKKLSILVMAAMLLSSAAFAADAPADLETAFNDILATDAAEIENLMTQCENKGITTDYELVSLRVIKEFVKYGIDDFKTGKGDRAQYVYDTLKRLSAEAKQSLNAYLDGTKKPFSVDKYVTGKVTADGVSLVAKCQSGEEKPVFFMGYGHFDDAMRDVTIFSELGVNVIEIETGPMYMMPDRGNNGDFTLDTNSEYMQKLKTVFDNAAKYNISINLLLSPHYMPGKFYEKYPQARGTSFSGADLHEEHICALYEEYFTKTVSFFKDCPALGSFCIANEPTHIATKSELPMYREWLKNKFGDIQKLNGAYYTSYADFEEIEYPDTAPAYDPENAANIEKLGRIYDFAQFNSDIFTAWHTWAYDIIKKSAPGILVGTKIMQTFDCDERDWRRKFIFYGTDPERMGAALTLNGNDANNFYAEAKDYEWGILNKLSYYDLQTSVADKPVFDFEDHVIRDRDANYGDEGMARHVACDMWEGAMHGRAGSTMWIWARTHDDNFDFAGSVLHRPDVVEKTGRAMLDINRLSAEVTALEKSKKRIGILYSDVARMYSKYYSNSLTNAYEAASYAGEKIDFVTEKQAAGGKLKTADIDTLIIPYAKNVISGAIDGISEFAQNGGKIIALGSEVLSADEYNKPLSAQLRQTVLDSAAVLEIQKEGSDQLKSPAAHEIWQKLISLRGSSNVQALGAADKSPVYGAAYQYTVYGGKLLVNICNYDYNETKNVALSYKGKPLENVTELRSGEPADASGLKLTPYQPLLLCAEMPSGFADIDGHWAKNTILSLYNDGVINGVSETAFEPETYITRRDFAALVSRAAKCTTKVDFDNWDLPATRGEMAKIMIDAYETAKPAADMADVSAFTDFSAAEYKDELAKAVRLGLILGVDGNRLDPQGTATRAQAATVIERLGKIA